MVADIWPGLVALVITQGSLIALNPDGSANAWNLLWCLLPLVPAAWLVRAQWRGLRRADEYQRTLQLEAMAIGFAVAMMVALVGGLLDAAHVGGARQSLQITFIAGVLGWIVALAVKTGRAR